MNRRLFFRALAAVGVLANTWATARADNESLARTPRDYEGPFYPQGPRNRTSDLIVGSPRERLLSFSGRVVGTDGKPLDKALFDFWQADPLGNYLHPRGKSADERWDEFLYWGEAITDADGRFNLRTYVPGDYGSRPPHIHFKIWSKQKHLLTSQVYFAELGGPRGAARSRAAAERQTVHLVDDGGDAGRADFRIVV